MIDMCLYSVIHRKYFRLHFIVLTETQQQQKNPMSEEL